MSVKESKVSRTDCAVFVCSLCDIVNWDGINKQRSILVIAAIFGEGEKNDNSRIKSNLNHTLSDI